MGVTGVAGPSTDRSWAWAWTASIGAEFVVTERVLLKTKYRYVDATASLPSGGSVAFSQVDMNQGPHPKADGDFRY